MGGAKKRGVFKKTQNELTLCCVPKPNSVIITMNAAWIQLTGQHDFYLINVFEKCSIKMYARHPFLFSPFGVHPGQVARLPQG